MVPSEHLFDLIKTLNHGEIKHFRRHSRQNPNQGTNNYLRLFEALLTAEAYNEAALKKKFEGEGLEKNFANVKRYLYKQILGFLAKREWDSSPRVTLEMMMTEGDVLWKKGLYGQGARHFEKLARQAQEAGFFDLEIRALTMLQRDRITNLGKGASQSLESLEQGIKVALRRMQEMQELSLLRSQLFFLTRQFFGLDKPEVRERTRVLMEHPLLHTPLEEIDFFEGKRLQLSCHGLFAYLNGDRAEHARIQKQIVQLWEAHPQIVRIQRNQYRLALANQLGADGGRMDFSDFPQTLEKLHSMPTANRDEEVEVFQNTAFFELLFLMNSGQFEGARKRVPDIEAGLRLFADNINQARMLAFRYNLMVLFFVLEDYSSALRQLNLILHDEATEHRQDIQQVARLFLLIFHFELGNFDLMEYLFRSAYRYLYNRGSLGRFERAVLAFLRKTANLPPGKAMFPAFEELLGQLQDIAADKSTRTPPGTEEIIFWLRSKLEGKAIATLARED